MMDIHWHDVNPWADKAVYLPLDLAAIYCRYDRPANETIEHWKQYGEKLDAYILPQPSGHHCLGVRYGPEGREYLSCYADEQILDNHLAIMKAKVEAEGEAYPGQNKWKREGL